MADEHVDLPFAAEYAKSGRSSCKGCKASIADKSLRMAVMVQSPVFDGKMPNWYHFPCFFERNRIKTVADVKNFDQLRWEDQEKIRAKVVPHGAGGVKADATAGESTLNDYCIDMAKSARSICRGCNEKIAKGLVRISKKDFTSDKARRFGPLDEWRHLQCFVDKRDELEFYASGDIIQGFLSLPPNEQADVREKLPPLPGKGTKRPSELTESVAEPAKKKIANNSKEEDALKAQNKLVFEFRDQLQKLQLPKKDLQLLLEHNDQGIPSGEGKILDAISDCMAFGALHPCPECKEGQLKLGTGGYHCTGNVTEWTKCVYVTKTPEKKPFKVPEELKEYPYLKKYKYKKRQRLFRENQEKPSVSGDRVDGVSSKPLSGLSFRIVGETTMSSEELEKAIVNLGGNVVKKINKELIAIISTQVEVNKNSKEIKAAKKANIIVVSEEFVQAAKGGDVHQLIKEKCICSWGDDITGKLKSVGVKKDQYTKKVPAVQKLSLKGGANVNPSSGLEGIAHVYVAGSAIYNAVLGMVDITTGLNSFYQLQLLEADGRQKFWVYRSWGRIGTTIGRDKLENFDDLDDAKDHFEALYEEKTGNRWSKRNTFVKYPNRFYPMDIDYGQVDNVKSLKDIKCDVPSKLPEAIQDLICMIFDVELMKSAMTEFELDLSKMPLGKISKKQIEQAFGILTELQQLIKESGSGSKFLDASNRFFTLIPHNFGMKKPPILNSEEMIMSKIEMLDSLLEIEVAYSLMKSYGDSKTHPIDGHFKKLNVDMTVLQRNSKEFELLQTYMTKTHAATHNQYSLNLKNIFKVSRQGEAARYKPFKKLHNRMLLWHGSRTSNYAGILSQGLRIAPPEAPVTGYMFGKGVYFADIVSKSANYCRCSKEHSVGLMLLCEVALGDMYELKNAEMITKLPTGKHSTKGQGATEPNPASHVTGKDGVVIPVGEPTPSNVKNTSLLYNEYIVYDTAQVNVKYLLEVDFKWNF